MTNEDKNLIADYMGWQLSEYGGGYYYIPKDGRVINFDANASALCVQEMQKRGDLEHNFIDYVAGSHRWNYLQCIAWMFVAENFFNAMSEWLKEKA